ncbi:phospholipid scramblase 2-like [Gigantopelta aegis]|uniref:phospholipid scramblase 2-like n=1 Tax=Gigantopelta aegis TaxID=1735272 RepID=UPI001B88C61A|nr:phospholipid scramblase 2-like [Gigantopelta aegis]XP_041355697.1 phospholipid scramblase 2-like [Gigantopelta aegis]
MANRGTPPGLEYLTMVDQLLIHQKAEILEALTGFETSNKYVIKNSLGQQIYYAVEDTDCCTRNICGRKRPFDMKILDNAQNEVIHLYRPLRCTMCCFPCCLQKIVVEAPPGQVVGYVSQCWYLCYPHFTVKDSQQNPFFKINGPLCQCSMCGDVEYKINTFDGAVHVGQINKQWSGVLKEQFTDADNFSISFPLNLDVTMKAVLLGAVFLLDYMFFEKGTDENQGLLQRM